LKRQACAFTGHRSKRLPWRYDETLEDCVRLKAVLATKITELVERGVTDFLSGMEEGIDQICAELVLEQREKNPALKLHCILPCLDQDAEWPASARERYRSILSQADSIVYVSRVRRPNCMMDRNRFLADHASILLAIYNGTRRSGTGATINYARKLGREIIVIDPALPWEK